MSPIRERAKKILDAMPGGQIRSNDGTGNYTKYTGGITQEQLEEDWSKRKPGQDGLTGCNSFVGWYAAQLGAKDNFSLLDLYANVQSIGKGYAWVQSTSSRRPQYGDILQHAIPHLDVALDFEGDILNRMAAGQGGRSIGYDILMKVRGKSSYNFANLKGWLDIDLYFGAAPAIVPTASWLNGWWNVWDGNQYYYFFGSNGYVQYTKTKPTNNAAPPKYPLNQGVYTVTPSGELIIDWNPADGGATRETFSNARLGSTRMNGTSNRYAPLVATRI
ncbi:MAG: hypothetical protein LUQ26_15080 [Methylococcaceae bacterium]|nr:hypothetical protein [Methylococcaceae bacterium]